MSSEWTAKCETCDDTGPYMRRAASHPLRFQGYQPDFTTDEEGRKIWQAWLMEHAWHDVRLQYR